MDVYRLIVNDLLGPLRAEVQQQIPARSPFSGLGTRPILNVDDLHRAFANAHSIQITAPPRRKNSAAGLLSSTPAKPTSAASDKTLRVTKAGLLSRKGLYYDNDDADMQTTRMTSGKKPLENGKAGVSF